MWPGGVQSGGVHIHHLVWGICLMMLCGFVAFAALVVLGTNPFGLDDPASIAGTATAVALVLGLAVICFAQGRVLLGVIGLFIPFVALVGALRLAGLAAPRTRRCATGQAASLARNLRRASCRVL